LIKSNLGRSGGKKQKGVGKMFICVFDANPHHRESSTQDVCPFDVTPPAKEEIQRSHRILQDVAKKKKWSCF